MNNKVKIFKLEEVEFKDIYFTNPQIINDNEIFVPIQYKNQIEKPKLRGVPLMIQLPSLLLNDDYDNKGELLTLIIGKNEKKTELVNTFLNKLDKFTCNKLEELIRQLKKTFRNILQGVKKISYTPIIDSKKKSENNDYENEFIRMKILKETCTKVYDENKTLIEPDNYMSRLVKGVYIKSILEIAGLYIKKSNVKLITNVHQICIEDDRPIKVILDEYSFIDSEKDSEKDIELRSSPVKLQEDKNHTENIDKPKIEKIDNNIVEASAVISKPKRVEKIEDDEKEKYLSAKNETNSIDTGNEILNALFGGNNIFVKAYEHQEKQDDEISEESEDSKEVESDGFIDNVSNSELSRSESEESNSD